MLRLLHADSLSLSSIRVIDVHAKAIDTDVEPSIAIVCHAVQSSSAECLHCF